MYSDVSEELSITSLDYVQHNIHTFCESMKGSHSSKWLHPRNYMSLFILNHVHVHLTVILNNGRRRQRRRRRRKRMTRRREEKNYSIMCLVDLHDLKVPLCSRLVVFCCSSIVSTSSSIFCAMDWEHNNRNHKKKIRKEKSRAMVKRVQTT